MPNYSSSSVSTVDWAMGFDGCSPVKKRNLLENLHDVSETKSPTPTPPPFQDFITLVNTKKRTHTSSSLSSISSDGSFQLPHQTPSPSLDHANCKYTPIRARPLYNFKYNEASIWTQSSANSINPLLCNTSFDTDVVNKFFVKESHPKNDSPDHRSRSSSMTPSIMTRAYQLLDKSSQITYDVTMRHLLQLLSKDHGPTAKLDDVLDGIESGTINNEWLQCVQRLTKALHKQLSKRPEDKLKLETFDLENLESLNLVERFFVKLLRLPNYSFKLKCYQYRDELQSQLTLLHQSIDRFLHGIEFVRHHAELPGVLQVLCYLYNLVSNKCVPGLDLVSLGDALNSPTNQCNKTVAHVLAQVLEEYYPDYLNKTISDEKFTDLKNICSMKYEKLFAEIRDIYHQYEELEYEYFQIKNAQHSLPAFVQTMLKESKIKFEHIFQQEPLIRKGEADLAAYFCSNELSADICLSTVGHFVDKLRLAHLENSRTKTISRVHCPMKKARHFQ